MKNNQQITPNIMNDQWNARQGKIENNPPFKVAESRLKKKSKRGGSPAHLDWSGNGLASLDSLHLFPDLEGLNVSENQIKEIAPEIQTCSKLQFLNISSNRLNKIQNLTTLTKITTLNLSGNLVARIEGLNSLRNLQTLDLSHNRISLIENLQYNAQLQTLNLAHNMIDSLRSLLSNKTLMNLDLSYNRIESLANGSECLPEKIKTLKLGNNRIKDELCCLFLLFLENLEGIDFSSNPFIEELSVRRVDYRGFIVFLTQERIKYLNGTPVTSEELSRSRKFFTDSEGHFCKDLFHKLITEEGNRKNLIEYLASMSMSVIENPQTERGSRKSISLKSHDESYRKSLPAFTKSGRNSNVEEDKSIIHEFGTLQSELKELKQAILQISPQKSTQTIKASPPKNSKLKFSKSLPRLPLYILTLNAIHTSVVKKKVKSASTKERAAILIQKIARGFLVRKRLFKYKFQQYCIILIQSHIRGFLIRRKLNRRKPKKKQPESCCENCLQQAQKIANLEQELATLKLQIEESVKTRSQQEKVLQYLFAQVASCTSAKGSKVENRHLSSSK